MTLMLGASGVAVIALLGPHLDSGGWAGLFVTGPLIHAMLCVGIPVRDNGATKPISG
ncbi:MAG: hypothetical protein ACI835_004912 [Planctomycetota bacterium]|jgi:hypothetical protein